MDSYKILIRNYQINFLSMIKLIICVFMTFIYSYIPYSIFNYNNDKGLYITLLIIIILYIISLLQEKSFAKVLTIFFIGTLFFSLLQINLYLMVVMNIFCLGISHKSQIEQNILFKIEYWLANIITYSILCPLWLIVLI